MYDRANWRHFDVLPPCIVFPLSVPMARYRTCTSLSSDRPTVRVWHVHTAPIPSDVGLRRAETDSFGCWSLVKTSETAAKCMQNPPEKLKKWKSGVFYGFFQIFRWCFLMLPFLVLISWIGFFCEISGGLKLLSQQTTIAKSILEDQMVGGRRNRKRPKAAPSHNLLPNNPPIQSIDAHNQHFPCCKIP